MIMQCPGCGKVKKFGEWVDPERLKEQGMGDIQDLSPESFVSVDCPQCRSIDGNEA